MRKIKFDDDNMDAKLEIFTGDTYYYKCNKTPCPRFRTCTVKAKATPVSVEFAKLDTRLNKPVIIVKAVGTDANLPACLPL